MIDSESGTSDKHMCLCSKNGFHCIENSCKNLINTQLIRRIPQGLRDGMDKCRRFCESDRRGKKAEEHLDEKVTHRLILSGNSPGNPHLPEGSGTGVQYL